MNPEEVMQKYEKYINPSSTRLFRFMGLSSVEARAEGWIITDTEGTEFIDCLGGSQTSESCGGGGTGTAQHAHVRQSAVQ